MCLNKMKKGFAQHLNFSMHEWDVLLPKSDLILEELSNPSETTIEGLSPRYFVREQEVKLYFFNEDDARDHAL